MDIHWLFELANVEYFDTDSKIVVQRRHFSPAVAPYSIAFIESIKLMTFIVLEALLVNFIDFVFNSHTIANYS